MAFASGQNGRGDTNPEVYMEGAEDYVMDNNTNYDTAEYSFSDPDLSFSSPNFIGSPSGLLTSDTAFSGPSPSFPSVPVASIADQKAWMQTIIDMFELSEESEPEEVDDEAESAPVDMEAQNARTERLKTILPALDRLWWASSDFMADAAEKLADGSRDPRWRIPIGDSGILNAFLVIVATPGVSNALMIHVLRLIGNSCADRDENRERVVAQNYLPAIASLLKDRSLLPFVIPVLFNICIDYEPAQLKASEAFLSKSLLEVLSDPSFSDIKLFISYITKILDMLVTQPGEMERAPDVLPSILANTAFEPELNVDLEDYLGLIGCAIAYLQNVTFQQALVKQGGVDLVLRSLFFSYTRFEDISSSIDPDSGDDAKALTAMRSNMNQVLSDISALPAFAATYPVTSAFTGNLRRWLSSQRVQLQVCSCIILGNLARSDASCEEFVFKAQIHKPLIAILDTANDSQILHAALGFLRNLALPAKNKVIIGDADIITILPRLWQMDSLPQIQYSAISLARQLAIDNMSNVRRLCVHLSDDPNSPAYDRSRLSLLIAIFKRTDAEPIKMEISRLITAICRAFTSPKTSRLSEEEQQTLRQRFFARHTDVGRPIAYMVSQNKWPVVRSEGWFVMALMARTPEGAICVSDLMHDISVFQPLVETLTGKGLVDTTTSLVDTSPSTFNTTPSNEISTSSSNTSSGDGDNITGTLSPAVDSVSDRTEARMQQIDRENALVLVSELLKNRGSEMASMRRGVFEDLLRGGGTMHLTYAQIMERENFFDSRAAFGAGTGAGGATEKDGGSSRREQGITTVQEWAESSADHILR